MPAHYQGRHRSAKERAQRRSVSLLAASALAMGAIASDATDLGVPQMSAASQTPVTSPPGLPVNAPMEPAALRPVVSSVALGAAVGGAGMVSVATGTMSRMSTAATTAKTPAAKAPAAQASAAARKGPAPKPAPKAPATKAKATANQAPKAVPAPERGVGYRASLGAVASTPGGVAVPMGIAAARSLDWSAPVSGTRITSGFGPRWGRMHAGLDFAGPVGTPIRAVGMGVVTFAGSQGAYGNKVEITLWDGTEVHYGHLSRINVKVGEQVSSGARIGALGNTGRSTGPHLHLEVRPGGGEAIDPRPWLEERGAL